MASEASFSCGTGLGALGTNVEFFPIFFLGIIIPFFFFFPTEDTPCAFLQGSHYITLAVALVSVTSRCASLLLSFVHSKATWALQQRFQLPVHCRDKVCGASDDCTQAQLPAEHHRCVCSWCGCCISDTPPRLESCRAGELQPENDTSARLETCRPPGGSSCAGRQWGMWGRGFEPEGPWQKQSNLRIIVPAQCAWWMW